MKQVIFSIALMVSGMFSNVQAAADTIASPEAVMAFQKQYSKAKQILWEDFGSVYKVSFEQDGKYAAAFYDNEGKTVSVVKNVSLTELPSSLRTATRKHFKNYWITELVHINSEAGKGYYVIFEDADHKVIMKSVNDRRWVVYQTMEKL
jgi:hypothetical protein